MNVNALTESARPYLVIAAVGFIAVFAVNSPMTRPALTAALGPLISRDCIIKGNISISSGARIYHLPGDHYYKATVISPQFGERWFFALSKRHEPRDGDGPAINSDVPRVHPMYNRTHVYWSLHLTHLYP